MKKIYPQQHEAFAFLSTYELSSRLGISSGELSLLISIIPFFYHSIPLKKKDGSTRVINAPERRLKEIQKKVLTECLEKVQLPHYVYGGVKGKSIIDNAKCHVKGGYLLNIDIKDFFPSVHWKRIRKLYIDLGCFEEVAEKLCKLTTLNYQLPQGAPTSPYLSNLVLTNLDTRLFNISKAHRLTYTRFFDDISISGNSSVKVLEEDFLKIIESEGYKVKYTKKFLYETHQTKKVTGILIDNGRLDVENKQEILSYLTALKDNGLTVLDSSIIEKERQSLAGKISFIKSIDVDYGKKLSKLFDAVIWSV